MTTVDQPGRRRRHRSPAASPTDPAILKRANVNATDFNLEIFADDPRGWHVTTSSDATATKVDVATRTATVPDATTSINRAMRLHEALRAMEGQQEFQNPLESILEEVRLDALAHRADMAVDQRLDAFDFSTRVVPEKPQDAALGMLQTSIGMFGANAMFADQPAARPDAPESLRNYYDQCAAKLNDAQRDAVTDAIVQLRDAPTPETRRTVTKWLEKQLVSRAPFPLGKDADKQQDKGGSIQSPSDNGDSQLTSNNDSAESPQGEAGGSTAATDDNPKPKSMWDRLKDWATGASQSNDGDQRPGDEAPSEVNEWGGAERSRVVPDGAAGEREITESWNPIEQKWTQQSSRPVEAPPTRSAEQTSAQPTGRSSEQLSAADVDELVASLLKQLDDESRSDQRNRSGRGSNSAAIGRMEIHHHVERSQRSQAMRRPMGATDTGQAPVLWERYAEDGQVFQRRRPGGAILIDCSGSMSWDWDVLSKAMSKFPSAVVGAYSGSDGSGKLCVLATDGRWCPLDSSEMENGNEVDIEALRWLSDQKGPRVWLSDGHACGGLVARLGNPTAGRLIRGLCAQSRITRCDSVESAIDLLSKGEGRQVPGSVRARDNDFIPWDTKQAREAARLWEQHLQEHRIDLSDL
jgi:hypothetical protein